MAANTRMSTEVVRFPIWSSPFHMIPEPMKPTAPAIPVMIRGASAIFNSGAMYANAKEPKRIRVVVRIPITLFSLALSCPINNPSSNKKPNCSGSFKNVMLHYITVIVGNGEITQATERYINTTEIALLNASKQAMVGSIIPLSSTSLHFSIVVKS